MQLTSAKFMRGVGGTDELLDDGTPQVAFIGRSNVGKSSIINSLAGRTDLARTSDTPGLTQEINIYAIGRSHDRAHNSAHDPARGLYLLDLPGYGFARAPRDVQERLQKLIYWYLFDSPYQQRKTILIIDAKIGPTDQDLQMLQALREHEKHIVIVANKIDKIKKSEYDARLAKLADLTISNEKLILYSAQEKIGVDELRNAIT
jgi:GTP-binding protein